MKKATLKFSEQIAFANEFDLTGQATREAKILYVFSMDRNIVSIPFLQSGKIMDLPNRSEHKYNFKKS